MFPDFRELYDRLRTIIINEQIKRRHLELRLGEDVRESGLEVAIRLFGEGDV